MANVLNGGRVASLFSGIGGFELGLQDVGFVPVLFCESDPAARAVLRKAWPSVAISDDICSLQRLPDCEVVTAGFPCQDLSQAGPKAGIGGARSGLVDHLFRLLAVSRTPEWVVIENVPYMLGLNRGAAMSHVIDNLELLGFRWAYRVVDSRAFGLPQRRPRVVLFASKIHCPVSALAEQDAPGTIDEKPGIVRRRSAYGFYWTEGSRGLGWVRDAIPPVKGGSGLGIPSPPAVWVPSRSMVGKPSIRDAERLQGFPPDWTVAALSTVRAREGVRWRLVGNAANVATTKWIGGRLRKANLQLAQTGQLCPVSNHPLDISKRWPAAAAGENGKRWRLLVGAWPVHEPLIPIMRFLDDPLVPLSARAASGFLSRALSTPKLVYAPEFLSFLRAYCEDAGSKRVA